MSPDLHEEYLIFKHRASIEQMNATEHEADMINYRLELLRQRYEGYSAEGLNLDQVRERELKFLEKIRTATTWIKE